MTAVVSAPMTTASRADLPAPVRRYLEKALPDYQPCAQQLRLQHGGFFRPSINSTWLPIRGEQHFNTSPPGFVWWGRVRLAPGVWIDARDRSVEGAGNMLVKIESTVTIADSRGPELDQGALLRLLGEMVWFPAVFLDERYVHWLPLDPHRARATLAVNGRMVEGDYVFGADDLPAAFEARRYRDLGDGKSALTPFVGQFSDYRWMNGMLIPHRVVGAWIIDGSPFEYVNFQIERFDYK